MKREIFSFAVFFWAVSADLSHAQTDASAFAERDRLTGQIELSEDAKARLGNVDLDEALGQTLAEQIASFQASAQESLGVELTVSDTFQLDLVPRADLSPDQIAISSDILNSLSPDEIDAGRVMAELSADEVNTLSEILDELRNGEGALSGQDSFIRLALDTLKTVSPISLQITKLRVDKLRNSVCVDTLQPCLIGDFTLNKPALIGLIDWMKTKPAELKSCRDAQEDFVDLEARLQNSEDLKKWRENDDDVRAALAFDSACLDRLNPGSPEHAAILERFAVLRMPNAITPFCSAYKIAPGEYLTAKHCFHNGDTGEVLQTVLDNFLISEFTNPAAQIQINRTRLPQIEDRSGPDFVGAEQKIPALFDYVVIFAEAIDPRPVDPIAFAAPQLGERVVTPGYFFFTAPDDGVTSLASWADHVRITKPIGQNYCRIYDASQNSDRQGCLIHRCQVIRGFSGSPMLQETAAGTLGLTGVHVSAQIQESYNCPEPFLLGDATSDLDGDGIGDSDLPITSFGNVGAMVSESLLSDIGYSAGDDGS